MAEDSRFHKYRKTPASPQLSSVEFTSNLKETENLCSFPEAISPSQSEQNNCC